MKPTAEEWTPDAIRALRDRLGVSQTPFGTIIGSDQRTVSELERKPERMTPRLAILLTYVDRFGPLPELAPPKQRPKMGRPRKKPRPSEAKRTSKRLVASVEKAARAAKVAP